MAQDAKTGLGLLLLCCALIGTAVAQDGEDTAVGTQAADLERQKQTVKDLRDVGTALMSWLTDAVTSESSETDRLAEIDRQPGWTIARKENPDRKWSYSNVSYDVIRELLEPEYMADVPQHDGWGHPYDFTLNADLLGESVLGIRSAGRDGSFETNDYVVGPFPALEFDHDLVFNDGYFARWPTSSDD